MKVSSVSPDRWEIMQAIPRERAAAIASNVWLTVPTWFFDKRGVGAPVVRALQDAGRVCDIEVIADQLDTATEPRLHELPASVIVLCGAIFYASDRIRVDRCS